MSSVAALKPEFEMEAAEAFSETVGNILNSGAVSVMLSIGHRTGLLDTMAGLAPSTSSQIANVAELAERYVREWLAVMVTGGIVTFDPVQRTYHLPAEHAACLTRSAELGNMAVYAQFIPMTGSVQERILKCFETGEGVDYGDYPCFHSIMAEDSAQSVVSQLFDTILPLADGLQERLEAGIDVMDAGCGSGQALIAMARRYPNSRFTGYDLSKDAIAVASKSAAAHGLDNIRFIVRDLTDYSEPASYDFITSFDAVHDQKDPQGLVCGIRGALRDGGVYLMQDIGGSAQLENNLDFPLPLFSTLRPACIARRSRWPRAAKGSARCGAGKRRRKCSRRRALRHRSATSCRTIR
ncbi:MAG TPA: class I SAM-dependent methyltransferase [Afifellaceae bacterium]|nr:class I SAM-dependent methyltransferase [Afifellaceae bacterium]